MEISRVDELLNFSDIHTLVIGDIMLDEYLIGEAKRISPEAPVPVVRLDRKVHRLGGAANVAMNTSSLGARTSLIGLIGDDESGGKITQLTNEQEQLFAYLIKDFTRKTTSKTRVLAANQNLLRIDNEDLFDVDLEIITKVEKMLKFIHHEHKIDIIILQDYNKGFFSVPMIEMVINWAKENSVKTALDPKSRHITNFKGVNIFKPNLKEMRKFLETEFVVEQESLVRVGEKALEMMDSELLVLTLSAEGIFLKDKKTAHWESTTAQSIVDVSGAGDTVISVASLMYCKDDVSLIEIAQLSNYAGWAVCKVPGVGVIDKSMIVDVIKRSSK